MILDDREKEMYFVYLRGNMTDGINIRKKNKKQNEIFSSFIIMSRTTLSMSVFLYILLLLNGVAQTEASASSDIGQFFNKMGDKISQTAATIKDYLLELFYRLRAFFTGHTESTHQFTTSRGCGYAADDEPAIYNKNAGVVSSKIKGGDDAIWHTWSDGQN